MPFTYDPKEAQMCWDAGDYPATLKEVEEKVSQSSGNPMLDVTFLAYNGDQTQYVHDYIVRPSTIFKLKLIAKALGEEAAFNAGTFDLAEFVGNNLTLTLKVENSDKYGDQNRVAGYKANANGSAKSKRTKKPVDNSPITDEEIPF